MKEPRELISERMFNRALYEAYWLGRNDEFRAKGYPTSFSDLATLAAVNGAADEIAYELDITSARQRSFLSSRPARWSEVEATS